MLEGEQPLACLDYVRKLDEKYPGRACLQSMRVSLETALSDSAADSTLAAFLKQHPGNPIALAEKALQVATQGDPLAGIDWLQQAIEACGMEMPARVYDAIGGLALILLSAGHMVRARAHLQLQLGLSQGRDERAVSTLLQLEGSAAVPVLYKTLRVRTGAQKRQMGGRISIGPRRSSSRQLEKSRSRLDCIGDASCYLVGVVAKSRNAPRLFG